MSLKKIYEVNMSKCMVYLGGGEQKSLFSLGWVSFKIIIFLISSNSLLEEYHWKMSWY